MRRRYVNGMYSRRSSMTADITPPPLPPIPYATRQPRRWFSLRTTVLALALTEMLHLNLQLALRWKDLFTSLHLRVPGQTQLWFDAADWWSVRFGWAIAWPLAVVLPMGITLLRRRQSREMRGSSGFSVPPFF